MRVVKEDESARAVHTEQNIHEESKDIVYPERVMLTLGPTKDDYRAEKAFEPESTCNNLLVLLTGTFPITPAIILTPKITQLRNVPGVPTQL